MKTIKTECRNKSVGGRSRIYQMRWCRTCPLSQGGPVDSAEEAAISFICDEERPDSTLEIELKRFGHSFPAPEKVADEDLPDLLNRLVRCLADLHVYLFSTDHLSNRELYERLVREELPRETSMPCLYQNAAMHIDLIGNGSDEDVALYLKYYAGKAERKAFAEDFPGMYIPPAETPPYDRDRHLPQREELNERFAEAG